MPTATNTGASAVGIDVGIDVGIVRFPTLRDGSFIAPLGSFKKHETRLGC